MSYPTVLQTITNPDGTVSLIHVDPSNPIITLPDGTTAQVQGVATVSFFPGLRLSIRLNNTFPADFLFRSTLAKEMYKL